MGQNSEHISGSMISSSSTITATTSGDRNRPQKSPPMLQRYLNQDILEDSCASATLAGQYLVGRMETVRKVLEDVDMAGL